jgi:hypothetical protein
MLTPSHSSSLPPPSRLESTCKRLLEDGEYCLLVGVVEKWAESQDPTVDARLAQAEAMLELKLMDKAWVRLKAMVDSGAGGVRPHVLSARMFIERGWPGKARKVIHEGLERHPNHAGLNALLEEAAEQRPAAIDPNKADADDIAVDELILLAEHFMVQGAFVRARAMLERVRRADPSHRRSKELLQALDGQFDLDEPLSTIVSQHAGQFVPLDLADIGDDQDHTESASMSELPLQIERDDDDRFPSLFRRIDGGAVAEDTADFAADTEVTAVTSMSEMHSMLKASAASASDASDDTQIMRVVHRGGVEPVAPGAAHTHTPEPDASFNLADFQREMGMVPRPMSSDMDFVGPEDEDESVVVVTRLDDEDPDLDAPQRPRITLDTQDDKVAEAALGTNVDEVWRNPLDVPTAQIDRKELLAASVPPPPQRTKEPEDAPRDDEDFDYDPDPAPIAVWPWWLAVMVLVMALLALLFAAFVLVMMLG